MLAYAITIFLSAFLLFQIEPMITRVILPWFGGSAEVWTTCLLFFQVALFLGYLYAYGSLRYLSKKAGAWLHGLLLLASAPMLYWLVRNDQNPRGGGEPAGHIFLLLSAMVGMPFFLLSTTGPLLQSWVHENDGRSEKSFPYRLYALSNVGSLLALLSYPALVEPNLSLQQQLDEWAGGYLCFIILCAAVSVRFALRDSHTKGERATAMYPASGARDTTAAPSWSLQVRWILLAACSSTLLLAVTSHLSQNVAAIPFLWILPLSLYLLTFIICFGPKQWRWNKWFLPLPALALGAMAYALSPNLENLDIKALIPLFAAGLFICCMLCHGELARSKPAPDHLAGFYLMVALGGALGGVFAGLVAPYLFRDYYELQVGIMGAALLALFLFYRSRETPLWNPLWLPGAVITIGLGLYLLHGCTIAGNHTRVLERNFYGVLRVEDFGEPGSESAIRLLTNGTIQHGEEFISPHRYMEPITYYAPESGVGLAIREAQSHPQDRVGVIGLGAGTIAAYGRPGDFYEFYDINPLVVGIAHNEFSFLRGTKAQVTITLGDARLSLQSQPSQEFDVLAVDAFTSDSIPVHLLTQEAYELYFRHLKAGGVLAVHVSNRYLDLAPVVERAAREMGKEAMLVKSKENDDRQTSASDWVLVTARSDFFKGPLLRPACVPVERRDHLRLWTDQYSNLFQILR